MVASKTVLVIPGEGIGVEVTDAMMEVAAAANFPWQFDVRGDINSEKWMASGIGIPSELMSDLKRAAYDAILFGAMGDPRAPEGAVERDTILRMRFELSLALNIRPLRLPPGIPSVLASGKRMDSIVVRENTEGAYAGASGRVHRESDDEVAVTTSITTRRGVRKALLHGFGLATRRRSKLCLIHKSNVIQDEGSVWRSESVALGRQHPGVDLSYLHADAAAMRFITHPDEFDVIVTDNLFGDLLTDLGAALCGGIGLAASSSLNPETGLALFEPIHGTAPDIAGSGRANPLAMVRCLAMCAAHLGHEPTAQLLSDATDLAALRGGSTTKEYTQTVLSALH